MKIDKKRRIENKTDYNARLAMLKSKKPRAVVRKSNKYLTIQYIESFEGKDKIIFQVSSKELIKLGWSKENAGSLKSIPACYLSGYCFGKELNKKKLNQDIILDIGLIRNVKGNRIYAVLKGIVDSGVNISYNEKAFPNEDRISGKHLDKKIIKNIEVIKSKIK